MKNKVLNFEKIKFFNAEYNFIIKLLIKKKGYLVMPAASSLVDIARFKNYKIALQKSTAALFDSGYFCIILLIMKFKYFNKFSGYKFIGFFLNDHSLKYKKILCLSPSLRSAKINDLFLKSKNFKFIKNYACPKYNLNNLRDINLLNIINKYKPEIIISNIGGTVQEVLAFYINNNINNKTIIICSGAALSFYTGEQASITPIIDQFYLGWLKRLLFKPKVFYKRIIKSIPLFFLVISKKIVISYK
jgi:UDP-N-acetyl-D-mannosaminuronic acid transferase (WecB/TagA/CpsF family)